MNYSRITDSLYIGTTPKARDYDLLCSLGIQLVINMRFGLPPVRELFTESLKSLWLPAFDSPFLPIPISFLHRGAVEALKVIESGGAVYTHCSRGRHRGPAMGACILIAQGMPVEEAMDLIKQQRPVADLQAWYIRRRILKFAQSWKDRT